MSGGDGYDSLVSAGSAVVASGDTWVGGDGADKFVFGTATDAAASTAQTTFHVVSGFQRGSDKIQLFTGFFSGTPGVAVGTALSTSDNTIVLQTNGTTGMFVHLNGAGAEGYLPISVTGVSQLDLNDFEFLAFSRTRTDLTTGRAARTPSCISRNRYTGRPADITIHEAPPPVRA